MNFIETSKAPAAIGPYSQAVLCDKTLFTSGQLGIDPKNGVLMEGIEAQTQQALENLSQILLETKMSIHNVAKVTIFLQSMKDFQKVNDIYAQFFGDHKPARSTIEVSALPKSALIEIEAIATKYT